MLGLKLQAGPVLRCLQRAQQVRVMNPPHSRLRGSEREEPVPSDLLLGEWGVYGWGLGLGSMLLQVATEAAGSPFLTALRRSPSWSGREP